VYVTVGNEEKSTFLMENWQIPKNRIFNSHSESFVADLMKQTNGAGVDVVLNSLSGPLFHASWKCVARHGTMVEFGKRDLMGNASLSTIRFLDNRSFFGVDIAAFAVEKPGKMKG
jgi:NADPH:quinone reductase-like Zn-dependent oxidoreductase